MAACLSEALGWTGQPAGLRGLQPRGCCFMVIEDPAGPYTKLQKGGSPSIPDLFLFSVYPGSRWGYRGSRRKGFASATLVLKGVGDREIPEVCSSEGGHEYTHFSCFCPRERLEEARGQGSFTSDLYPG